MTLSTGREIPANNGILGLEPLGDGRYVLTDGYDSIRFEEDPAWGGDSRRDHLTLAERQELADLMVKRWQAWARQ